MRSPKLTLVSALTSYLADKPNGLADTSPPLGVTTLAAIVKGSWAVEVVNLDFVWERSGGCTNAFRDLATKVIVATRPDVLGFSSISGSYPATIRLAEACTQELDGTKVVLGGPQASVVDVPTLRSFPFIDYIVRGEAEESFPALLGAILGSQPVSGIYGLTFREHGQIRRNPNAPVPMDLDHLPLPLFDLLPEVKDFLSLPLEAGRGCPFACTFCSTNDFFRRRFRLKSPSRMLEEMRLLNLKYGATRFDLIHDMFTVDRRKVVDFCEVMINAGSPYEWSCSARTDCVDTDLLRLMRKAGCYDLFFGIETGSQRMQGIIDKNLDLQQSRRVFVETNELGMSATASLIVGYPQETGEDLRGTVRFYGDVMKLANVFPQFNILSPLPATPLTLQYMDELSLDADWTSISENGTEQDESDQTLIAAHKDIFTNFYAFPCQSGRNFLRCLRDFLVLGAARCSGLIQAMHQNTGDLVEVYKKWEFKQGEQSTAWYCGPDFLRAFLRFAEEEYSRDDVAIRVAGRFYAAAFETASRPRPSIPDDVVRPAIALPHKVALVTSRGDINAVLLSLQRCEKPHVSVEDRTVTVAVREADHGRVEILELPSMSLALLRHAEKFATVEEVVADFASRGLSINGFTASQIVPLGIRQLETKGLLQTIHPKQEAIMSKAAVG